MADDKQPIDPGAPKAPDLNRRRGVIAGVAALVAGALAAKSNEQTAQAVNGDPLIAGTIEDATSTTGVVDTNGGNPGFLGASGVGVSTVAAVSVTAGLFGYAPSGLGVIGLSGPTTELASVSPAAGVLARAAAISGEGDDTATTGLALRVEGRARMSAGGRGSAEINKGNTTFTITDPAITEDSIVIVVLTSDTDRNADKDKEKWTIGWVEVNNGSAVVHTTTQGVKSQVVTVDFRYVVFEVPKNIGSVTSPA